MPERGRLAAAGPTISAALFAAGRSASESF